MHQYLCYSAFIADLKGKNMSSAISLSQNSYTPPSSITESHDNFIAQAAMSGAPGGPQCNPEGEYEVSQAMKNAMDAAVKYAGTKSILNFLKSIPGLNLASGLLDKMFSGTLKALSKDAQGKGLEAMNKSSDFLGNCPDDDDGKFLRNAMIGSRQQFLEDYNNVVASNDYISLLSQYISSGDAADDAARGVKDGAILASQIVTMGPAAFIAAVMAAAGFTAEALGYGY
jgi:hypothetical protein